MPVTVSAAQARALLARAGGRARAQPPAGEPDAPVRRRAVEPGLELHCYDCGEPAGGETAQSRHLADTGHRRYQWEPPCQMT